MTDHHFGKWVSTPPPGEEIVITGLSGRFPESNNVYEFRDHLFNKDDMVTDDNRRWVLEHSEVPKRNAKIFNIDQFDPGYFGIHHRQTNMMDPMIRIFLETAIEAIMDAGVNPSELEGSKTGVFVGACYSDSEMDTFLNTTEPQQMTVTGFLRSLIPNRLSYYLKLKGPSYIADTACSSSMNALEHAFKAIRCGQCDSAIVGGTNLLLNPGTTLQFFRLGVLSPEGKCKVFDQDANGYVRGESIASIYLQKAKNAKRIYGEIIYSKINSDGFKSLGITFPSTQMQQQLMSEIFDDTGLDPSDLSFLEAHGTGTEVGDPQEVEAIDRAIAKNRKEQLLIGSVKSSIGHTEPASGLCSLAKVIIAMETGRIPPNINLTRTKKEMVGFEEGRLKAVTETTDLVGEDAVIGINNFGFGGNNCHLLVRRFKKKKVDQGLPNDDIPRLVCVSGRSEEAVLALLDDLNRKDIDGEYVALFHELFKKNIPNHIYRGYTIISKNGPLKTSAKFFGDGLQLYINFGQFDKSFKALGRHLLNFPIFKTTMSIINKHLSLSNANIIDTILANKSGIKDNLLGAVAVQIGIVDILKVLGLNPTAVYGDSLGKLASAYYNETITLKEAILTAYDVTKSQETISKLNFEKILAEASVTCLADANLRTISKNSTILNISDEISSCKDLFFVNDNTVTFLDTLGSLYEQGCDLQLQKLFPQIQYPVSRGTSMISPLIKWNYKKRWHTFKFAGFASTRPEFKEFKFSTSFDDHKFILGHVIDGRNLFPATGYLYLVLETYVYSRRLDNTGEAIIFENCKFMRAISVLKSSLIVLLVSIQQGTGRFEVTESGSLVATGRVFSAGNVSLHKTDLAPLVFDEKDPALVVEQDDIYREMYIRGYNYSGLFKGLVRCNAEATTGLVRWENNWIAFMDKLLQIRILHMDTRLLYVPTGLKKLVIEPLKLSTIAGKEETCLIPVHFYKELGIVKCKGVEISGLQARAISRRKSRFEPVLEKHEFVPNEVQLDVTTSVRVNAQIILENSLEFKFNAVEILDDFTRSDSKPLSPLVKEVLGDIPLINSDLTISTKAAIEAIPGVKVEDFTLTPKSNLLLIIGSKILQRSPLTTILSTLKGNGFALTREEIDFVPDDVQNIEILTRHVTEDEQLILFRESRQPSIKTFIEVSSNRFDWIPELKNSLKKTADIVVYSQNQELEGILGLVNCIRREPGGARVRCFFIVDGAPEFDPENPFYQKQIDKNLAINIYKNNQWGTYRHLPLEELEEVKNEHCFVNTTIKGDLSSLKWTEGFLTSQTAIPEDYTMIHTYYSTLNFKDIMLSSGRIHADLFTLNRIEQECSIGFEFSGRDLSGRRVIGIADNSLSTMVFANNTVIWSIPESWTLEDAATVPVVYSTVIFGLLSEKTLKPGNSILIHSATGGVGLAALNVCLYYGCEIFVTVGTQEKRDYLKKHFPQILDSHIGNSRDTSFEEMIKIQTNGRGVDIVLNSLIEEKLTASLRCLSRGGRFLEIGKYDLGNDTALNLLLMEREISYRGIMLDKIIQESFSKKKWLYNKLYEGLKLGYIKPLPRTVFKMDEVEAAFRFMTTGKHIGKVMIKIREEEEEKLIEPTKMMFQGIPRFNCHPCKSYIIIGGLGGIGMELADWLMLRGAKKLVLVTSYGIRTGYQTQRIGIWQSYDVTVHISKADVTTEQGCYDLIEETDKLGPIDAIFNLAVTLKDALFEDQTKENFQISLAPKAHATKFLDQVTRELCPNLRHFVVFSSVSCGRGNPAQTNYGMANSIMERICEKRKRDGFPALAIQWGAIGEVGLVAKMQKENKELVIGGTLQQKVSNCFQVLDKFLCQKHPIVSSMVVAEKRTKSYDTDSAVEAVIYVLGIKDLKSVNKDATLIELGMDSITGTEIVQLLERDFDINIPPKDMRNMTFAKLMELEAEKKNASGKNSSTVQHSVELFLKHVLDTKTDYSPITKMPSLVGDEEEAVTAFVLPGMEGILISLESFISNLNVHVFGMQYSYHNPDDSMEEIAKTLLPHIEDNVTKDQTFHLIGYSFGAIVALEVASLLENKGYNFNIIAIDGAPAYLRSVAIDYLQSESEAEMQTNLLLKLLSVFLPMKILLESKEKFLECKSYEDRVDLAFSLLPSNVPTNKLNRHGAVVLYKRFRCVLDYSFVHDKIKSPVSLFKAQDSLWTDIENDYKLSELCKEPVTVTVVEGDHTAILNQTQLMEAVKKMLSSNNEE